MSRRRFAASAAAALLFTGAFAAAQSNDVTLTLSRSAAEELYAELGDALAVTTTTAAVTTTTAAVTTTTAQTTTTATTSPATTTTTVAATTTTQPSPTTTSPPSVCNGVQVPSGANLVTVANAHQAGTTFCLAPGTYNIGSSINFETGDRWFGALAQDGSRLSIITGNGSTSYLVTSTSTNVLLANVVVERFNNATQQGVNTGSQKQWIFENVEVRENNGHGLHSHDGTTIRNSYIHHNQQMGLGGNGDNVLIENNEIAWNNYQARNAPGWEGGGTKWVHTVNLVVRGNYSHHNCGNGLWTDGHNTNFLIENNVSEYNWAAGIFSEINPGPGIIRNNVVTGNAFGNGQGGSYPGFVPVCSASGGGGAGGIRVNDSRDVEVYGNVLVNNEGGISSVDTDRGANDPNLINLDVHDNEITWTIGRHGIQDTASTCCGTPFASSANNHYENNIYRYLGNDSTPFQWAGNKSWAQWQSVGHDRTGSFD